MTGFELIVMGAFFALAMILRAESKAADRQHEELKTQLRELKALIGNLHGDVALSAHDLSELRGRR